MLGWLGVPCSVQIYVPEAADILSLLQMPATVKAVQCFPLEIKHSYNFVRLQFVICLSLDFS